MRARRQSPKTGWAKAHVVAKTRGPEDRSGEDACRREDTWEGEGASRRQVWRRHASSRRHVGVRRHLAKTGQRRHVGARRHFPKTGRVKTRVVAKTHGRAKTPRKDRSGKHSSSRRHVGDTRSDDSPNCESQCVLNCRGVLSVPGRCMQVHIKCCSRWHSYTI